MIIIIAILLFILLYNIFSRNTEQMETTQLIANEAIQNLASMYNSDKLKATELDIVGNISSGGDIIVKKDVNVGGKIITTSLKTTPKCETRRVGNYIGTLDFLDRFPVECKDGEYLQGWHLTPSYDDQGHQPWEIRYKCCTLNDTIENVMANSSPSVAKLSKKFP